MKYFSSGIEDKLSGTIFLQADPNEKIIGFRYQWEDENWKYVYNGTEKFDLDKKNQTIEVFHNISPEQFSYTSIFYNSFISLKNALPLLIKDNDVTKAVSDTTIGQSKLIVLRLGIRNKVIGHLGDLRPLTTKRTINYTILIDPVSYLPTAILQTNSVNQDFIKTTFTQVDATVAGPPEKSWYFSTYLTQFKQRVQSLPNTLISSSETGPEWVLPEFGTEKKISLTDQKGKIVLLEFWIRNCAYCQAAFPELSKIAGKFKGPNFQLLAINCYDTKNSIAPILQQHAPEYQVLYNGLKVADAYGITGYPTAVLIDKNGIVVYAGIFNALKLSSKIKDLLAVK
ncbi:TlpA family protein disulfide reductase [Mucilaginibacter gilvus]|uniref:TlpA family protein disulfide reductase n=1 Tax=Mucilaginibacter gilvus TaxID=2305909 RepID=UPI00141A2720|nr:TlpA disulfide reductase family protein [Mucilaginibacter gilvus]